MLVENAFKDLTQMIRSADNEISLKEVDKEICAQRTTYHMVRRLVFNKEKYDYCQIAISEYKKLDITGLQADIGRMRVELKKLIETKRGVYCAVCDVRQHKHITPKTQIITQSKASCLSLLANFKEYLLWKNDRMIEYITKLYDVMSCFSTDGSKEHQLPYQFFAPEVLEVQKTLRDCVTAGAKADMAKCMSLCQQNDLFKFSRVFEGDKKLFEQLFFHALNLFRTRGYTLERPFTNNRIKSAEKRVLAESKSVDAPKSGHPAGRRLSGLPRPSKSVHGQGRLKKNEKRLPRRLQSTKPLIAGKPPVAEVVVDKPVDKLQEQDAEFLSQVDSDFNDLHNMGLDKAKTLRAEFLVKNGIVVDGHEAKKNDDKKQKEDTPLQSTEAKLTKEEQ